MGLTRLLRRLAAAAPAPTFVAAGTGAHDAGRELQLCSDVDIVASPRHATVLLVVGSVPDGAAGSLERVHDQLPHPRGALWWDRGADAPPPLSRFATATGPADDAAAAVADLHRRLLLGEVETSPPLRPDVDPNPWRGIGPYGQGGKGMTGGTPYGRPLPGRAPDRDGLELDRLSLRLGPWLSMLPPGLMLDIALQGDVVQEAEMVLSPLAGKAVADDIFSRALHEPVSLASLEIERARHHLQWAADMLSLLGLRSEGERVLRVAASLNAGASPTTLDTAGRRASSLANTRRLVHPLRGVGRVPASSAPPGPLSRASGSAEDLRASPGAYRELGFEPVAEREGDALARWRVRLREAAEAIRLAGVADPAATLGPLESVEGPRGPLTADEQPGAAAALVSSVLPGLEWGDAVVALASLDLDPTAIASVVSGAPEQ